MSDLSPGVTIVELDPADSDAREQAAQIMHAAFPHWTATIEDARQQVELSVDPERICLTARASDDILGWIGGMPQYSHAWELHPLVVRADARRQGIGRALVAALESRLREREVLTLYLGTDDEGPTAGTTAWGIDLFPDPLAHATRLRSIDHAAGFYQQLGFVVIGLIPDANGPGKPDILMAKRVG